MTHPHAYENLGQLGVATVYEAAGRNGLLDIPLHHLGQMQGVAGPGRTILCQPGDNATIHIALKYVKPGEILVIKTSYAEPVGFVGELLATQMIAAGVRGFVTDGGVRDSPNLRNMPLVILARHIRAAGATKERFGSLDEPVIIGGCIVHSGDIVVLDPDGAVAIPNSKSNEILEKARDRAKNEDRLRNRYEDGYLSYDEYGLSQLDPKHKSKDKAVV